MTTLNFNLKNGMDTMVRVMSLLRRKGFDVREIRFSNNVLAFDIPTQSSVMVLNNMKKLADVRHIA